MPVRSFDGVDDRITLALGSLGFAFGPGTLVAIQRRSADAVAVEVLIFAGTATLATRYGLTVDATGKLRLRIGNNAVLAPTITVTAAEGWSLLAITKASGTVAPRFHKYVFGTATWTHENAAGTITSSSAPTGNAYLGSDVSGSFWPGDIGIAACSNVVLNDAAIEALVESEAAWSSAGFVALWPLDQASTATAVQDTIGAADQTAITGTTVSGDVVPWTGPGTTHETASWQSSYVVRDRVTSTWQTSYVVRDRATAAWQSSYVVHDRGAASWASSYSVTAHVSTSWQSSYVVHDRASASWQSSYGVNGRVIATWATSYGVQDHATVTWASSYAVRATATWQSTYSVTAHPTATWTSSYEVGDIEHETETWASSWATTGHVAATWETGYVVRVRETEAWASSWTSRDRLTQTWQSSYVVTIPDPPVHYSLTLGTRTSDLTLVASTRTAPLTLEVT